MNINNFNLFQTLTTALCYNSRLQIKWAYGLSMMDGWMIKIFPTVHGEVDVPQNAYYCTML
jgi:hypothetical protein